MSDTTYTVIACFLLLYCVMLARSREVKTYQVILIGLTGFVVYHTSVGYPLWLLFDTMAGGAGN